MQDDASLTHPMQVDKILVVNDQSELALLSPVVGDVLPHPTMDVNEDFVVHGASKPTPSSDVIEQRHEKMSLKTKAALPSDPPMEVEDGFYVHDASRETFASSDILEVLEPMHDNTMASPPMEVDTTVVVDNQPQPALCTTNSEVPEGK